MSKSMVKTILVVDDEVSLQQLIRMTLETQGYRVEIAGNGLEALEKLKKVTPDLIILDMNMPKMGGVEFYQKICDESGKPQYPVFVLTARANMEQLFKSFNIDGFMAKPFEIDDILREIAVIIKKREASAIKTSNTILQPWKVCVIDDDPTALGRIGAPFLSKGFSVHASTTGSEGIERAFAVAPDVVLVKLGLPDISGDMVIMKLKRMPKTKDAKYILYVDGGTVGYGIAPAIANKEGIDRFVAFTTVDDLLNAVEEVLTK